MPSVGIHLKKINRKDRSVKTQETEKYLGEPIALTERFVIIIFGGAGDLACQKLLPALFTLFEGGLIGNFEIIGVGRTKRTSESYRELVQSFLIKKTDKTKIDSVKWEAFMTRLSYFSYDLSSNTGQSILNDFILERCAHIGAGKVLCYMAVHPKLYLGAIDFVVQLPINHDMLALVLEKPIGLDKESAFAINSKIERNFREDIVYRIDHFLQKETVQSFLWFRGANPFLEPGWNNHYVDHIQITAYEEGGIGERGDFYDSVGVIRDMLQNHVLQLLAMIAVELPAAFTADQIIGERIKVFMSTRIVTTSPQSASFGQYVRGMINDTSVPGYREERGIPGDSNTPTFCACKCFIDNWRWARVPIYIRAGKRMGKSEIRVVVVSSRPPVIVFKDKKDVPANRLDITIQPKESVNMVFYIKEPGSNEGYIPVDMGFEYDEALFGPRLPAYSKVLLDCIKGDRALFTHAKEVEIMWDIVDPLIKMSDSPGNLEFYQSGSISGPRSAIDLISADGREWLE